MAYFFQVNVKGTDKLYNMTWNTWNFWNRVSFLEIFGDRKYSSWTVDGTVQPKSLRSGWSWCLGKVSLSWLSCQFFWASWLSKRFSNEKTLHQQVIKEIGLRFWVQFLTSMNSSSSWVWRSLMAMKELVQLLCFKGELDQVISSLWCGCSPIITNITP